MGKQSASVAPRGAAPNVGAGRATPRKRASSSPAASDSDVFAWYRRARDEASTLHDQHDRRIFIVAFLWGVFHQGEYERLADFELMELEDLIYNIVNSGAEP